MEYLLAVAFMAMVFPSTYAAVGSQCARTEENPVSSECDAAMEFCEAQRVCKVRFAGGFFPYWGCEYEGTCQLKQQLNMTCYTNEDCASSVCRNGRCVECGNSTQCQQFQYCDVGVFRPHAPLPLELVKMMMEKERNNFIASLMRFVFWWKEDLPMCKDFQYKVWTEEMVRESLRWNQQTTGDRFTVRMPNGDRCRIPEKYAKSTYAIMDEYFVDKKTGWWWKPEGAIYLDASFTCQSKMPDNSHCLRPDQCSSGYCDGGRCKSTPPMCGRNVSNMTNVGCPSPTVSGMYTCHGSWDVTVPNQCFEVMNCTSDASCTGGQFCYRGDGWSHCVQCVDDHREDPCGSNGYCEFGVCVQKKVDGYCGKSKQCLSGQCNAVTNMCLPAGQLNPTFVLQ